MKQIEEHGINKSASTTSLQFIQLTVVVSYNGIQQWLFISSIEESDTLHPSVHHSLM